jgi:hypothetical protein
MTGMLRALRLGLITLTAMLVLWAQPVLAQSGMARLKFSPTSPVEEPSESFQPPAVPVTFQPVAKTPQSVPDRSPSTEVSQPVPAAAPVSAPAVSSPRSSQGVKCGVPSWLFGESDVPQQPIVDDALQQANCINCDGGGLISPYGGHNGTSGCGVCTSCPVCGPGLDCYPGRERCCPCEAHNCVDRFFCTLYECICCPDPCYEGKWTPIADSAFFVDAVRPQTQMGFKFDTGFNLMLPDRAEYFWARADGNGRGPKPIAGRRAELGLNYTDAFFYTEAATSRVGAFVEMSYRSLDPTLDPHAANFGDMRIGTKTMLLDCELLQFGFEFTTYLPVGDAGKGLGTGHVSLEPSLLLGIRVGPDSYIQTQVAEWIPVGGDKDYAGAILHYHFSWNNVLYRFNPQVPVIGTLEMNGWTFQHGEFTDPGLGPFQPAVDYTYVSAGPGLRLFVCDKIDVGFAVAFALTEQHWASTLYRTELRFRF